jgi:hypothetical protein
MSDPPFECPDGYKCARIGCLGGHGKPLCDEGAAERLRAVAAWFSLAAERLESGDRKAARDYTRMGLLGAESDALAAWLFGRMG